MAFMLLLSIKATFVLQSLALVLLVIVSPGFYTLAILAVTGFCALVVYGYYFGFYSSSFGYYCGFHFPLTACQFCFCTLFETAKTLFVWPSFWLFVFVPSFGCHVGFYSALVLKDSVWW